MIKFKKQLDEIREISLKNPTLPFDKVIEQHMEQAKEFYNLLSFNEKQQILNLVKKVCN